MDNSYTKKSKAYKELVEIIQDMPVLYESLLNVMLHNQDAVLELVNGNFNVCTSDQALFLDVSDNDSLAINRVVSRLCRLNYIDIEQELSSIVSPSELLHIVSILLVLLASLTSLHFTSLHLIS